MKPVFTESLLLCEALPVRSISLLSVDPQFMKEQDFEDHGKFLVKDPR